MRTKEKTTVSDTSNIHKELLSMPGPLAKELPYNDSIGKQSAHKVSKESIADLSVKDNLQEAKRIDTKTENQFEIKGESDKLETISMTELYDTVYPPKLPVVEGLIYAGTYLFVGAPKVGKSFFMAQLGYHVSKGIELWNYQVRKGTVLYLALEDDYARLQKRLSRMFGMESSEDFHFATQSKNLNAGLEEQLNCFLKEHTDAKLIIIDTLQKVREVNRDKSGYASDYDIVTKLKNFSDKYGICILVVHHTRKMESSDSFDMISGTNGLLGAADGAFVMQKEKRTENKAVLEIAGRDQQDQRLLLEFDREHCVWKLKKAETELWKEPADFVLETISKVVSNDMPEWCGTATELMQFLPEIGMQPNVLTRKLNIGAEKLYMDYGVRYESSRDHSGRRIKLRLLINE